MLVSTTTILIYNQAFCFAFPSQCSFPIIISFGSQNYGEVGYVFPNSPFIKEETGVKWSI